ncbi:MAG TPA: hypothetical protein VNY29_04940 [Terriglobales bacterium]|nr:hypothetical protein [Terriglobales bacterium]
MTVPIRNDTQDGSHRIEPQQILIEGAGIPGQELSRHRFNGTPGVQLFAGQDHEVSNEVCYISVYGTRWGVAGEVNYAEPAMVQ